MRTSPHALGSLTSPAPGAESTSAVSVVRLVHRVTMGVTASEVTLANQLGWQGYLNRQLNYTRIDDTACDAFVTQRWPFTLVPMSALLNVNAQQSQTWLRESTLFRAVFSKRQLHQRMVEFWTDHFSQDIDRTQQLLIVDQREVIRKHALGKFPDMVRASAKSPSMLAYLDQYISRSGSPNENYARELMELHTLGVDGGYTQTDVAELARVLTGWTINLGNFVFNPAIHDWGAKRVMDVNIPAGAPSQGQAGLAEGERIIEMLVAHPSTARYVSWKMLKWLLTPEPTKEQVDTVAAVYMATGGDIKSMVRVILNETWVAAAPPKVKRPFHFLVSALRATDFPQGTAGTLNTQLVALGQPMFNWDTPDGYPDSLEYWVGNITPKWNFASSFTATMPFDSRPYLTAGSPAAAIDLLDQTFFGGEMPLVTREGLLEYAGNGAITDARTREMVALVLCSNAFQWY
jgi:uncharacterized protein (DUF1800 family)